MQTVCILELTPRDPCTKLTGIPSVILKFGFNMNWSKRYLEALPALHFHE